MIVQDDSLKRRNAKTGQLNGAHSLCFSRDAKLLACVGTRLAIYRTSDWQKLSEIKPFPNLFDAAFSDSGQMVAVKNTIGKIAVFHPTGGQLLSKFSVRGDDYGSNIEFVHKDSQIVDGTLDGTIRFKTSLGGELVEQFCQPGVMINQVQLGNASRYLLVVCQPKVQDDTSSPGNSYLLVGNIDALKNTLTRVDFDWKDNTSIQFLCLSPDGHRACLVKEVRSDSDGEKWAEVSLQLEVRSTDTWSLICQSPKYEMPFPRCDASWSPCGNYIVAPIRNAFVMFEADSLKQYGQMNWQYAAAAAFHPAEGTVVLASSSKTKIVELTAFQP